MGIICFKVAASRRSKAHIRCVKSNEKLQNKLDKDVSSLMDKAFESGGEVDAMGKKYANDYGGTVTPINYKSRSSINRKLTDMFSAKEGTISDVKDSVRNTVVVKTSELDAVRTKLLNDPNFSRENGGRVKFQDGPEYYGYKGIITNFKTKNGITAEMQFNTPGMIYAKSSKKEALNIMTEKEYNNIYKKTGVKGGKGHDFYDEILRLKNKKSSGDISKSEEEEMSKLINESEKYYSNFYKF